MPTGGLRLALIGGLLMASLLGCAATPTSPLTPLHRSTVLIEHEKGHGSGLIVGKDRVLTAFHVVQGEALDVRFFSGQAKAGHVIWSDSDRDLALVDVDVPEGHPVAHLSCDKPAPGQHVIAVGHPIQSQWVMMGGYLPPGGLVAGRYVSLGFPVGLGTSGGPVFDEQGEVVGITLAILAERTSTAAAFDEFKDTGIGLMLPSSDFCKTIGVAQ
ncbi:MAG: serine protease [Alphaproteobacteria bacterium]